MSVFLVTFLSKSEQNLVDFVEKLLLIMDKWDNDLLVTHRGVINMIYYLLNNKKPDMYKDSFNVTHASVHKLDLKNKNIERIY